MARPTARSHSPLGASTLAAVFIGLTLAACGDDPMQRTEERYCTEVGDRLAELSSPVLVTEGDIDNTLDAWRAVSRSAPVAVQSEWETVVAAMETAAEVDPADPASVQAAADAARSSEPAANFILTYTLSKCGAKIGVAPAP